MHQNKKQSSENVWDSMHQNDLGRYFCILGMLVLLSMHKICNSVT